MMLISESVPINIKPVYQLRKDDDEYSWISEGNDPQFILRGPFEPGFWELDLLVALHKDVSHGKIQLYYAPDGDFKEEWSMTFPSIPPSMQERKLRFYLPFRVESVRLDPLDSSGGFYFRPLNFNRKGMLWIVGWLIKSQIISQSPLKLVTAIPKAIRRVLSGNWKQIFISEL